jgi:hypothetical protein
MKAYVISASLVSTGQPVYLDDTGTWGPRLENARIYESISATDTTLSETKTMESLVCDPFILKVEVDHDLVSASDLKWRIRAGGETAILATLGYGPASTAAPHRPASEGCS